MKRAAGGFVAFAIIASLSSGALADIGKIGGAIGKIGSPVVPSNAPKPQQENASAPASQEDNVPPKDEAKAGERKTLLVIPFNHRRVNFLHALAQAVMLQERASPGANYDIVAMLPPGNARDNSIYSGNMNAVLNSMQNLGVSLERIHVSTENKADGKYEDIYIYGN